MDRSTSGGGYSPHTSGMNPLSNPTIGASVEDTAQSAHQTLDKVSGKTAELAQRIRAFRRKLVHGFSFGKRFDNDAVRRL